MSDEWVPPGGEAARARGCVCPVMDNNRGKWPPVPVSEELPKGGWYMVVGCPVHDRSAS